VTNNIFLNCEHSIDIISKFGLIEEGNVTQTLDQEVLYMWKIPEEEDH
jgi:hypothetical protein